LTVERTLLQERLASIVKRFPQRRILVIGDALADQFVHGAISRVSREAPVFILKHEHTETVPGGAANCAANLASLGAHAALVSVVGEDEAGRSLLEKLQTAGVDCSGVVTSPSMQTTTKVRILAGQLHSTRQQVIRIDYDGSKIVDAEQLATLRENARSRSQAADAVIMSDYDYGVANAETISLVRELAGERKVPVLVDSRFHLSEFGGFTAATPNEDEVEKLLGKEFSHIEDLETAAEQLRDRLGYRALLVTRGSNGMTLLEEGVPPFELAPIGAREAVDVTGAGDTVMAAFTLALASDSSFPDAARLANYAGGLVVMKRGTASVTAEELETSIHQSESQ